MGIIDWDHVEWAATVEKTRDIQPRDFEDYKRMACVAMSLRAQITQIRAEIAAERELADRLADTGENVIIAIGMGWDLDGVIEAYQDALTAHATRRNTSGS